MDEEEIVEIEDAEALLKELGINRNGEYSDNGTYTVELKDSNDFGKMSSILDKSELAEPIDETSYFTAENGNLDYKIGDAFMISLIADFDNDYYTLVVTEME